MLVLNPSRVEFGPERWDGVEWVSIERRAERAVVEWSDRGPHAVFADVAEQRVIVTVVRSVAGDATPGPALGRAGRLVVFVAPGASDAQRRRVSIETVVMGVEYEVGTRGGRQRVTLAGVSVDGAGDPVEVSEGGAAGW